MIDDLHQLYSQKNQCHCEPKVLPTVCLHTDSMRWVGAGADSALMSVRLWDSKFEYLPQNPNPLQFQESSKRPPPFLALKTVSEDSGFRIGTQARREGQQKRKNDPITRGKGIPLKWMVRHFVRGSNGNKPGATFECKREFHGGSLSPWLCAYRYFMHVLKPMALRKALRLSLCYTSYLKNGGQSGMQLLGWDSVMKLHEASWSYMYENNGGTTVAGRNHAPVDRQFIPLCVAFYTSQVVQEFFHQQ